MRMLRVLAVKGWIRSTRPEMAKGTFLSPVEISPQPPIWQSIARVSKGIQLSVNDRLYPSSSTIENKYDHNAVKRDTKVMI